MEANSYMDDLDMDEAGSGYGYDDDNESPESPKNKSTLRLILLILFILLLVILVGVLLFNIFFGGGDEVGQATATPTPSPTSDGVDVIITPMEPTQTPTRVLNPTATSTVPPIPEPTDEPEATPAPTEETSAPGEFVPPPGANPGIVVGELLENGDFETFTDGVGDGWTAFQNDSVIAVFSPEGPGGPYVESGDFAQRITMAEATQPDRYAGIYRQVNVMPGQVYSLTLNGQIRTGYADVNQSSYGYRVQYAIDPDGGDNWQDIPAEAWVELPWDEQQLHSPNVEYLNYTTAISATSDTATLYVRVWNKWANPAEVQYSLDSFSLTGASASAGTDDQMIDQPLPITGENDTTGFVGSGTFWGALVVLALLAAGAIYRSKWSY